MKKSEFRNLIREEIRKVLKENDPTQGIKDYFEDYGVKLTSKFNFNKFAKSQGLTPDEAETLLVNLEDENVMKAIANGNYDTFDSGNEGQFNDSYEEMMIGLGWADPDDY